jgi:hypothetical protein
MKKVILLAMCMVLIGAGAAMADLKTINNNTIVYDQGGTAWGAAYGVPPPSYIGERVYFGTPYATFDTVSGQFTIATNWNPVKDGYLNVNTAFLFIDKTNDGTWDYAIVLDSKPTGAAVGTVYTPLANQITYSFADYTFGKFYDYYDPISKTGQLCPVLATGATTSSAIVTWSSIVDPNATSTVSVNLKNMLEKGQTWSFFWGSATCANGAFYSSADAMVPVPASVLLFGTGLVGLVGWRWRSRKSS